MKILSIIKINLEFEYLLQKEKIFISMKKLNNFILNNL